MKKQFHPAADQSTGDPKEKKIVNEQEQNKPVNPGNQTPADKLDQPGNESSNQNESSSAKENEDVQNPITNQDADNILNKDKDILPD